MSHNCYNAFTGQTLRMPSASTIHQLRNPSKYWIVSDAQLKRDLKPRMLRDVYRENRALRGIERSYVPRWEAGTEQDGGLNCHRRSTWHEKNAKPVSLRDEYLAECAARNHVPHPASIDSDHPRNCHRESAPKVERISPAKDVLSFHINRLIAEGNPVIVEVR